jgi:hypothetical protein
MLIRSNAGEMDALLSLSAFESKLTVAKVTALENTPLSVIRKENEGTFLKAISLMLIRVTELINVTNSLTPAQIAMLTTSIGDKYYYLRLEELAYVFSGACNGRYGKSYNRLDAEIVMAWIENYDVNERTPFVVAREQSGLSAANKAIQNADMAKVYQAFKSEPEPEKSTSHLRNKERQGNSDQDYNEWKRDYLRNKTQQTPAADDAQTTD